MSSTPLLLTTLPDNTDPRWYKDAGLRRNVALGLGLCLVIATNVSLSIVVCTKFKRVMIDIGMYVYVMAPADRMKTNHLKTN